MDYCKVCKKCGQKMKQIPVRKINNLYMLELFCEYCEESQTRYENLSLL